MENALWCVAQVIDILLGKGAAAPSKLECGPSLVILGVSITMSSDGFTFCPAASKVLLLHCLQSGRLHITNGIAAQVTKWLKLLRTAIHAKQLLPGTASKLAGKLSWGASQLFHRVGRAMLRCALSVSLRGSLVM